MEAFGKLMNTIGVSANPTSNFVTILPVEIAQMIFRKLDARSLLNVAKVSRRWRNVCQGDCRLRQAARCHLQREKQLLYDVLPSHNEPKKAQRSSATKENVKKFKRTSTKVLTSTPVTFKFGSSGVSRGVLANQSNGRNFGTRQSTAPKRSISKFR